MPNQFFFDALSDINQTLPEVTEIAKASKPTIKTREEVPFTEIATVKAAQIFDTLGTIANSLGVMDYKSLAPELKKEVRSIANRQYGIDIENELNAADDIVASLPADAIAALPATKVFTMLKPFVGTIGAMSIAGATEGGIAEILNQSLLEEDAKTALDINPKALGQTIMMSGSAVGALGLGGKAVSKLDKLDYDPELAGGGLTGEARKVMEEEAAKQAHMEEVFGRKQLDDEFDDTPLTRAEADFETTTPDIDRAKAYSDMKILEEGTDQAKAIDIIIRNNDELSAVPDEARNWLLQDNKAYQKFAADTHAKIKQELDVVDDTIEIGASEPITGHERLQAEIDLPKAEKLAEEQAMARKQAKEKAQGQQRVKHNYETAKKELEEATKEFNKLADDLGNPDFAIAEARLTKAIEDMKAISQDSPIKGTLDEMYDTGVSPSTKDIPYTEGGGLTTRGMKKSGLTKAEIDKIKKQREWNKNALEDIEQDNISKIRKSIGKKVDSKKIELSKLNKELNKLREQYTQNPSKKLLNDLINKKEELFEEKWKQASLKTTVKDLADTPYIKKHKKLVDSILKNNNAEVRFIKDEIDVDEFGVSTIGQFNPKGNRILIKGSGKTEDTLVHELIHTVVDKHIAVKGSYANKEANRLFNKAKDILKDYDKNGQWRKNPNEFFAEVFSNEKLASKLKRNQPWWKKFINTVSDIVFGKSKTSKLNDEIDSLFDYMLKEKPKQVDKIDIRASKEIIEDFNIPEDKFANLFADVYNSSTAKNFRAIYNTTKKAFDSASRFKTVVIDEVFEATKHLPNQGKKFRQEMYEYLIKTDYESISEFKTRSEALQYKNKHAKVFAQAKKEIELLAHSMSDSRYMNNVDWRGNGYAIAKKLDMDESTAPIIEKLASIESMTKESWSWIAKNRDTEAFKLGMDLMRKRTELSNKLFKNNKFNRIKGYASEILTDNEVDFAYKRGAIPPETQTKIKGQIDKLGDKLKGEALVEYARMNDLGLVLDKIGNPKYARKVVSEDYKINELGKVRDFGEIMGETLSASVRKNNINTVVLKRIDEILANPNNNLFNGTGENFVKLTPDEIKMLPKQLRGKITSIHKEYKQMTIGNMEAHVNESYKSAQLLVKDLVRGFKENVVLKNPVSYVNNFMFNYTVGLQNGISPKRMFKYQQKAFSEYKTMRSLQEQMIKEIIANGNQTVKYKKLVDEIHSLDLYKLYDEGLAFSVMSDITSAPSYSTRMSDKLLKKLVKDIFKLSDEKADKLAQISSEIYLSPNAKSGKFLLDTFTKIDVSGRYGIAMDAVSKGKSYAEAASKSNSIFGDLDKLSPMWVQAISEFGAIPFGNWFYRIAGGLSTNIHENLAKAIAIGVGLYALEDTFGKRTESFNPMLTVINSPLDMIGMSPMLHLDSAEEFILPEVYDKASTGEPTKLVASDSF